MHKHSPLVLYVLHNVNKCLQNDSQTAKNAGCDSVGCLWGFRTREELEENGAVYIAGSPLDIFDFAVGNDIVRVK